MYKGEEGGVSVSEEKHTSKCIGIENELAPAPSSFTPSFICFPTSPASYTNVANVFSTTHKEIDSEKP